MKNSLSSNDISQLLKTSKPKYSKNFKFRAVPSKNLKVGFSIKRRYGSAVLRNRFKRQLRVASSQFSESYAPLRLLLIVDKKIKKNLNYKNELNGVFKTIYGKQR